MPKTEGTVLIVDDEMQNLEVLNHHLDSIGYEVLIANNGESALKRAVFALPDIILLDAMMPEMDGFETCRRIKMNERTAHIPVIFLTAAHGMEFKIKGFEAGAVDFITKPFHITEIVARMKAHMGLQRMRRELETKNAALQKEIEDRHRAEQVLRESEAEKQAILDGITANIAFVNDKMEILWANKTAAESVGKTPDAMIGYPCYTFWGDSENPCKDCPSLKAFQTRRSEHVTITTPDGRIWDEKGEPVFDTSGNLIGVVEIAQDITDMKRAEIKLQEYSSRLEEMVAERTKELEQAQKELIQKERLAMLGHFAGSMSHEIRNPLAVIDSSAYYLKMKLNDGDEKLQKHLSRIFSNVRKATAIIQSLLNLSQMKKPVAETRDLISLAIESVDKSKVPDTIEIILDYPKTPLWVNVEAEQIYMALKNIIKNAVQAMDASGRLHIAARLLDSANTEISISDSGPGITAENLENMFEPLFTTKTHGIGFGLSITKMIIENHGGAVRAETAPEGGACFKIVLPSARGEQA